MHGREAAPAALNNTEREYWKKNEGRWKKAQGMTKKNTLNMHKSLRSYYSTINSCFAAHSLWYLMRGRSDNNNAQATARFHESSIRLNNI